VDAATEPTIAKADAPQLSPAAYLRTLVLAGLLGVPVAFAGVLFQTAVHDLTHFVWDVVPDWLGASEPPGWYVIVVPGLAGLLVLAATRLPGHGGHSPLEGISVANVRPTDLVSILPAALATLALGLVLGPEAPLIALGIGLGALAVHLSRVEETEARLLVLAGAFAAIAALFGGPLIAAFLLLEMVAKSGMVPARLIGTALLPGFVAAGVGALVWTGVGDWPGLHTDSLLLPSLPAYDTVRVVDLAWCGLLAVAVAAVVVVARHLAFGIAARSVARPDAALVVAGLLVGIIAVVFRAVTDRPVDFVLFSGQSALPSIVAETSAGVLLLLVLAKGAAYALSLGSGFRGGPVFPAIALGTALGAAAAIVLPGLDATPAVATGIAAGTAAALEAPFTAAVLGTLLVGSAAPDVAPFTVLAAAIGVLAVVALPDPRLRTGASGGDDG
jgi:H+/Cl- antiporter ClcA